MTLKAMKIPLFLMLLALLQSCSLQPLTSNTIAHSDNPSFVGLELEKSALSMKNDDLPAIAFSHDDRLMALFLRPNSKQASYPYHHAILKIWDTRTGKLKYSTSTNRFKDNSNGNSLSFSAENEMLFIEGMIGPFVTWAFSEEKQLKTACFGYMGGQVTDSNETNDIFSISTIDGEKSLCKVGEKEALVNHNSNRGLSDIPTILHKNKWLRIYGIHQKNPKSEKDLSLLSKKKYRDHIDVWNINYQSTAKRVGYFTDRKNKLLYILEYRPQETVLSQWDYQHRKMGYKKTLSYTLPVPVLNRYSKNPMLDVSAILTPDKRYTALLTGNNETLLVLDLQQGKVHWKYNQPIKGTPFKERYSGLSFSPDGQRVVITVTSFDKEYSSTENVFVFNTNSGKLLYKNFQEKIKRTDDRKYYRYFNSEGSWIFDEYNAFGLYPKPKLVKLYELPSLKQTSFSGRRLKSSNSGEAFVINKNNQLVLWRKR